MASPIKVGNSGDRKLLKRRGSSLDGLEYHGIAGSSQDCQEAVMRLLQYGTSIVRARIVSSGTTHCMLLSNSIGDQIAVKSGFSSGYGGTGPTSFSVTLQLLDSHGVEIDEVVVDESLIDRLNRSALTITDVENITVASAVKPSRWFGYILDRHEKQSRNGTLWQEFSPVIPFSIVDPRIIDLALNFWNGADGNLLRGYRRLEDIVRERTGLTDSNAKLFSRAFNEEEAILTWVKIDKSEKIGRINLFTGTYMAYRNPRAHKENPKTELLAEFLLLNQLYLLEREAVKA